MLPASIAARGAGTRPQLAQITNEIDRSSCPGRGKHGTASAAARRGCICPDAQRARARYAKRWRVGLLQPALVSGIGTARRIRAMQATGHTLAELAAHYGCTKQHMAWLAGAHDRGEQIHRSSAERVAVLYLALRDRPGTSTSGAKRAAAKHWARPEHWDGVDIDDPAATSDLDHQRDDARTGITGDDIAWLSSDAGGRLTDEQIADRYDLTVDEVGALRRGAAISASRSQLTADDVYTIRGRWLAARAAGHPDPRPALAIEYGIGKCTVLDILTGRTWPHLQLTDILGDTGRGRPRKSASRHQYRPAS